MTKFHDFKKNADEEWKRYRESKSGTLSQQERDRFYQLYINWEMLNINRKLVWATWALVVATVVLVYYTT